MKYQDIINEFRLMCSDSWGDSMELSFAVAGEMYERGMAIPKKWKYYPSPFGAKDEDSYWTKPLETVTDEDLERLLTFCWRYTNLLKRHGKDY